MSDEQEPMLPPSSEAVDAAMTAAFVSNRLTRGEDALWMAGSTDYDAIVLDVMLPGIDGIEVCRRLRADGVWAPILMLTQTRSVLQILTGRDSGWNAQARDSTRIPWADLWMFHRRHTLVGLILAVTAGLISWSLLAWMSPALIGLGVSIPLAALVSSRGVGDWLRRRGVMVTPEEVTPPATNTNNSSN